MLDSVILCNHPHIVELGKLLWRLCKLDNKDIADLFKGEQNVRRHKPEWFKKCERVRTVCGRCRSDFTSPELIEYLRANVNARPCPLAAGIVNVEEQQSSGEDHSGEESEGEEFSSEDLE